MPVTLILTRSPLREFKDGRKSGRWGEMVVVRGPKVTSVELASYAKAEPGASIGATIRAVAQNGAQILSAAASGVTPVPIQNGILKINSGGGAVTVEKRFTTMERFRSNSGEGYYVQLRPKPEPYRITYEPGNRVVRTLRDGHPGNCFRVHGGRGNERGILIHEAPSVGWVIGCIGPRPLSDYTVTHSNRNGNPSHRAMNELIEITGKEGELFVLDW